MVDNFLQEVPSGKVSYDSLGEESIISFGLIPNQAFSLSANAAPSYLDISLTGENNSSESDSQVVMFKSGKIKNIKIKLSQNTLIHPMNFQLRKNGANEEFSFAVNPADSELEFIIEDSFSKGDLMNWSMTSIDQVNNIVLQSVIVEVAFDGR